MINELKQRVLCGGEISLDEAVALAETADLDALCEAADEIRKKFCGDKIDTCSIINARSGLCGEDCKWCSQSKHFATGVVQYEIVDTQRMLDLAKAYDQYGVKRFFRAVIAQTFIKPHEIFRMPAERGGFEFYFLEDPFVLVQPAPVPELVEKIHTASARFERHFIVLFAYSVIKLFFAQTAYFFHESVKLFVNYIHLRRSRIYI